MEFREELIMQVDVVRIQFLSAVLVGFKSTVMRCPHSRGRGRSESTSTMAPLRGNRRRR
jgi:hypothetical protein